MLFRRLVILISIVFTVALQPMMLQGSILHHHHNHTRYYVRHRTKLQHAKIIGGTAKTGASIGGLAGGPPGAVVGAVAGAGAGTAYDLKTRKVKPKIAHHRHHHRRGIFG